MGKSEKIILISIAILVVLLVICLVVYSSIQSNSEELKAGEMENTFDYIEEIKPKENIDLLDSHNQYYSILQCVEQYYEAIQKKDVEKVEQLLDVQYMQESGISKENMLNKLPDANIQKADFKINKIYVQEEINMSAYYINGSLNEKRTYCIVYLDQYKATYSISPISQEQYQNLTKNGQNLEGKSIELNNYNQYKVVTVNDSIIITKLFEDYQSRINTNIEESYNMLDENYRNAKFANIEEYKKYVNQSGIKNVKLTKYQKTKTDDYVQYVGIDEKGKQYIFRENAAMNYTVILDTYTIDLPEFLEKYNKESEEIKVGLNIQKIFDAINDGDYKYVYKKLDNTFKTNNFKSEQAFEEYVKTNFYTKNTIQYNKCQKNGNIYVYDISIINTNNTTQKKDKTIIMQLKQGTDFVISFNIK